MDFFEMIADTFTDADELMNFAATWGIQDSPGVRFRLFQLRIPQYGSDFIYEQLDNILQNFEEPTDQNTNDNDYVTEQEIEQCAKTLLFDEEMNQLATDCINDGEWSPPSPVMIGGGDGSQPGPSHKPDRKDAREKCRN
jgi:hypothetical protein